MTLQDVVSQLPLKVVAGHEQLGREVTGGYAADLLSNVMAQSMAGNVWVTMQGHQNIIAVAALVELSAVIIAGGITPEKETVVKSNSEGVVLLTTELPTFEIVGRLYAMGIAGMECGGM